MLESKWPSSGKQLWHGVLIQGNTSTENSKVILGSKVIAEGFIADSRRSLSVERIDLLPAIPFEKRRCKQCCHRTTQTVTSQIDLCKGVEEFQLEEIPVDIVLDLTKRVLETRMDPAVRAPSVRVWNSHE